MRIFSLIAFPVFALTVGPALAADVTQLASCTTKVFAEIGRTRKWSGSAQAGCFADVAVYRRGDGLLVSAWIKERRYDAGYELTRFSALESYEEMATPNRLAEANQEILERADRLTVCLEKLGTGQVPDDCQVNGRRAMVAGEETGVQDIRRILLKDGGRFTAVEHVVADTIDTPDQPADIPTDNQIPPGVIIELRRNGGAVPPFPNP